jgi:hypothetical protein
MSQGQFELDVNQGPALTDVVSRYVVNQFKNNKVIASYRNKRANMTLHCSSDPSTSSDQCLSQAS